MKTITATALNTIAQRAKASQQNKAETKAKALYRDVLHDKLIASAEKGYFDLTYFFPDTYTIMDGEALDAILKEQGFWTNLHIGDSPLLSIYISWDQNAIQA